VLLAVGFMLLKDWAATGEAMETPRRLP
jgi:hypothetical protein